MQTQKHTHKGKHRWLVAAPLFALCFVVSMSDALFPVTAAVTSNAIYKTDSTTILDTTSGAVLREGTVMVSSEEWTTLTAGSLQLSGWNGGFQVSVQQGVVTVAALTTPVLMSDGTRTALVPAFMQWKGTDLTTYEPQSVQSLPSFYVAEILRTLPASMSIDASALPAFIEKPDHFLVAAFHPLARDHARVLTAPALGDDVIRLLLLLTPVADTLSGGLNPLALAQWQDSWVQTVQTRNGKDLFATALPLLGTQIRRFDALQYPQRVELYTTAVLAIAAPIENGLSADARKELQAIRTLRTQRRLASPIADPVVSVTSSASSASSAKRVDISPDVLVEQTAFALSNAGFMSTSKTILKPVDSIVDVSNIVFGTARGDTVLHFRFDPTEGLVSGIEQNGQILPYAISLVQFTEWLQAH